MQEYASERASVINLAAKYRAITDLSATFAVAALLLARCRSESAVSFRCGRKVSISKKQGEN
jgi:hypothetical protein